MALVTTPGAPNADSYTSVEEADQYHSDRANTEWEGATSAQKEGALRRATDWIDATFHDRWPGLPTNGRSQALDWPRSGATDYYKNAVEEDIPPELKAATAEGALLEIVSPRSLIGASDAVEGGTIIKEVVGPLETSYSEPVAATSGTVAAIENHLIPLIGPSNLLPAIIVV